MQVPELKSAFRKLAVQYHPDKALSGCTALCSLSGAVTAARDDGLHARLRSAANELFQLVNEAWETLQNSSKRQICRMEHDEGAPTTRVPQNVLALCPLATDPVVLSWVWLSSLFAHAFGLRKLGKLGSNVFAATSSAPTVCCRSSLYSGTFCSVLH